MRKILVAGAPGAGKTTFARDISAHLRIPYEELDALYHGPGWTKRATFENEVEAITSGHSWVTEWQYEEARPGLVARADTFVWLAAAHHPVSSHETYLAALGGPSGTGGW